LPPVLFGIDLNSGTQQLREEQEELAGGANPSAGEGDTESSSAAIIIESLLVIFPVLSILIYLVRPRVGI